jgi:HAD superfamily hydrolase (TIGR01549 family)
VKIINNKPFYRLPDAILFDTDNTLYAYDPAHEAAQNAVREKASLKLSISIDEFDKAFLEARKQVKLKLKNTASSHSRLLYLQRMLEIMGLGSQVLMALDLEQTYWRTFLANAVLFDGVTELLDDLRLLSIPMAIVTDLTAQIQFRKVVFFNLDNYFDYIVTSEEAGYDKPHKAPFKLALEKIRPEGNCIWMIGDNAENDIRGAREQINAVTIQKLHAGVSVGKNANKPDATFRNFVELQRFISKLGVQK